jgi:hypothetical protein
VVLRKFVEDVSPHGRQLIRFDLATGNPEGIGTNGVGYINHFIPVDSAKTEALWQEVEGVLNPAIVAALAGTALSSTSHLSTLRNAAALHFVRSPQTLTIHNESFVAALQQSVHQWDQTPFAAESFYRHYGLVAAGPEALQLGAEAAQGRLIKLWREGGLFRLTAQRFFEQVCDRFDARGVELLSPANPLKEFLLGDVPALTVDHATGAAGLAEGVAVDQADTVLMPLTPRLLVVLGPSNAVRSIPDDLVDTYNRLQVRVAKDYVYYRPGADFQTSIEAWRN